MDGRVDLVLACGLLSARFFNSLDAKKGFFRMSYLLKTKNTCKKLFKNLVFFERRLVCCRYARDAMHKLDELCRSHQQQQQVRSGGGAGPATVAVSPPSSAATSIPVIHETTTAAATAFAAGVPLRRRQRRSMGESWSDGLFLWDVNAAAAAASKDPPADRSSKRHSAGAALADVVGGLGARPKVAVPRLRSAAAAAAAFDGCDWRRRRPLGILRAHSANVVSPSSSHKLTSRHLLADGRGLRVRSESSRVEVREEVRHRSLEPDDDDDALSKSAADSWRIASVLSDSYLPSAFGDCATVGNRLTDLEQFRNMVC